MLTMPRCIAVAVLAAFATPAAAQLELKIMAPAAPGGGWDETARTCRPCCRRPGSPRACR